MYALEQLPDEVNKSYSDLMKALNDRYRDKRPPSSYITKLEIRKLRLKESPSRYVSDIPYLVFKGYPTVDAATRDAIGLQLFLKGTNRSEHGSDAGNEGDVIFR